ncbi:hypothetical protein ACWKT5_24295 [Streptomyces avermitilis]
MDNLPEFFIIDHTGLVNIAKIETEDDRRNATFHWTGPSLNFGEEGMLVRAVAPPGFCLHIATFDNFRIHSKFFSGIVDPQVKPRSSRNQRTSSNRRKSTRTRLRSAP